MKDCGKNVVRSLFNVLVSHGVKHIVCSPGSRNAPLLIAAEARQSLKKHVIIDERAAAFFALGIASVSRTPVALVCTSGTALLNYAPAVAEAYHQGIPLIVISADRPMEWIDQDDSQTIRQFEALKNFVKQSYDLSDREHVDKPGWYENRTFNDAMLVALRPKQGPVHINIRLSPPLDDICEYNPDENCRQITEIPSDNIPDKIVIKQLASELIGKKVMIVAGFMMPDDKMTRAMLKMRRHPNVAIMAETISNIHLPHADYIIDGALCTLSADQRRTMQPDIVISVGGALVSRMLKSFLRECSSENPEFQHWSIGYQPTTVDCFQGLTKRITSDPAKLIGRISAEMAHIRKINHTERCGDYAADGYNFEWLLIKDLAIKRINNIVKEAGWCEMQAFHCFMNVIKKDVNLFISNGTAIRYAQLLPGSGAHAIFCNRGVSGIEGSTSSAAGAAAATSAPTILITGDMSFCHDLGGLAIAARLDLPLKIIVINNQGGGIFRFVKSTTALDCRDDYLCADPKLNIRKIAEAFGFDYFHAQSSMKTGAKMYDLYASRSRVVIEIGCPPDYSTEVLNKVLNQ